MKEFRQDAHCADEPSFSKVPPEFIPVLRKALELHYAESLPSSDPVFIGGANLNSLNFRWGGNYLKIAEASSGKAKTFSSFPAIVAVLRRFGVPTSEFLPSPRHRLMESFEFGEKTYLSYRQVFLGAGFFSGALEELRDMLAIVRKLLDCAPELAHLVTQTFEYPLDYTSRLEALLEKSGAENSPFDRLFLENLTLVKQSIADYAQGSSNRKNMGAFHCDLHPHNVLVNGGKVEAVVDLESFYLIPENAFVGFTAYKLARKCIAKKKASLGEVRKLLAEELTGSGDFYQGALTEVLRRLFSVLELHYLRQDSRYDLDLPKQLSGLREVRLILQDLLI